MTNNEALVIAANYDIILEMTGIDFSYSLELLEESKKVEPVKDKLDDIQKILDKKLKNLNEKKEKLKEDELKSEELKSIESEIKTESGMAQIAWNRVIHDTDFTGVFVPVDLGKIPKEPEHLDRRISKDNVSVVRSALVFLTRKNLIKK